MNAGADALVLSLLISPFGIALAVFWAIRGLALPAKSVEDGREAMLARPVGHIALAGYRVLQAGRDDFEIGRVRRAQAQGLDRIIRDE